MQSPLSPFATGLTVDSLLNNVVAQNSNTYLSPLPANYDNVSAVLLQDNLAVIPGDWNMGEIESSAFYDIETNDAEFAAVLDQIKAADFIAWDDSFFDFIGPDAKTERILSFPGVQHVHEAPVYVPETNELIFSDTSELGSLWAIDVDTYKTRNITTNPPLWNVNGGTYHKGKVYFVTNGNSVRGLYTVDPKTGTSTPVLNNYRGRHLNSPNDIVVDSRSNIWFTDPPYGWFSSWPKVQAPELPNAIYFFNTTSKALIALSNSVVLIPNGLALSADESILYVSDTNSSSSRPVEHSPTAQRNIWAFDVHGTLISNPRLIYQTESGWPDGLRVTSNGFLIIGALGGADVVDPRTGVLLGKINARDDIIYNIEPIAGTGVWFLTGRDHIYKVTLREKALQRK